VIKVTLTYTIGGDTNVENILHFEYSGSAPSSATCLAIAAQIGSYWAADLKSQLSTSYALEIVTVLDLASATGAEGESISAIAGTRTGTLLGASTSVVLNHQIARRYRGGKPKSFLPYFTNSDLATPQKWVASNVTGLNSVWSTFITNVCSISISGTTISTYVSVSYYQGFTVVTSPTTGRTRNVPKLRTGGPVIDQIVASQGSVTLGSQRRRNRA
jgi:hypothetical protein